MAGTGKSTIAQTVATTCCAKKTLGASFFFSRGGGDVGHAEKFVTTIAFQLANVIPGLKSNIGDAISKRSDIATQSLRDQWQHLVLDPLSKLDGKDHRSRYAVVLDALDECDDQNDIQIILQLLAEVRTLKVIQLRVLLTSRPEVRYGINQIQEHQDFVLHNIKRSVVDSDIRVFLNHEFGQIRQKYHFPANWPGEKELISLLRSADGLFIWAATACRFIEQNGQLAQNRLSLLLQEDSSIIEPARKLDEIYTTVLTNSIREKYDEEETLQLRELFRQIVGPIIVSLEPLSVSSLAKILGEEIEALKRTLSNLYSVLHVPEAESATIRLLHPSFRDFLLDKKRCLNSQFYIDKKSVHHKMYINCVRVMSSHLRRDMCNLKRPGADISELSRSEVNGHIQSHVQYTCRFWVYHYKESDADVDSYDSIEKFLRLHFLHWLEALALLRRVSEAVAMVHILDSGFLNKQEEQLQKPKRLLSKIEQIFSSNVTPKIGLQALIHDMVRFVLTFQPVLEVAPLQIYVTGLMFSPNASIVKKNFADEVPHWVSCISGISENWSPHLKTLKGHSDSVEAMAFSPDGKMLASGSRDQTVKFWDAGSGKLLQTLKGHSGLVEAVAFSPDGKMLALGSVDQMVQLWDARSGKLLQTLKGHSGLVEAIAFSPHGKMLASGSWDETVKLWDARSGKLLQTLKGHSQSVRAVAFSPDGKMLASGSNDQTVKLWDAGSEKLLQTHKGHLDKIQAMAFSPDGKTLASGSRDETVKLWDAGSGTLLQTLKGHSRSVMAMAFSPDGKTLASGSWDQMVKLWDAGSGKLLQTLKGHSQSVRAVAFSPDGKMLASGSGDQMVKLWDAGSGKLLQTLKDHSSAIQVIADLTAKDHFTKEVSPRTQSSSDARFPQSIILHEQWVLQNGERVLWLPAEYEPDYEYDQVAIHGSKVGLGYSSGRVLIMKFTL